MKYIFCALLMLAAPNVHAQDKKQPPDCKTIKENAKRVACYDAGAKAAESVPIPPKSVKPVLLAPLELKSVKPGMQFSEVSILYPTFEEMCGKSKSIPESKVCMHSIPARIPGKIGAYAQNQFLKFPALQAFGSAPIRYFAVEHSNSIVTDVSVSLSNTHWQNTKTALIEKFGTAHLAETSTIQNRAGASFDQEVLTWDDGDLMLKATQRSTSIDDMSIQLGSKSAMSEARKKMQEDAKVQAKNL